MLKCNTSLTEVCCFEKPFCMYLTPVTPIDKEKLPSFLKCSYSLIRVPTMESDTHTTLPPPPLSSQQWSDDQLSASVNYKNLII